MRNRKWRKLRKIWKIRPYIKNLAKLQGANIRIVRDLLSAVYKKVNWRKWLALELFLVFWNGIQSLHKRSELWKLFFLFCLINLAQVQD